ncbi:MAG: hypothetical protein HYR56_10140 [Acidobacteria bacterium]|nr:hypothetical protein [Acidobacteriota bacterium]MBI3423146.1 hypothetical protein [Acidobacteriota bacterium]
MTMKHSKFALLLGLFGLLLAVSPSALAQSTIFNIPSTDVVAKKKTYFEFDLITHLEGHKDGGFQTYVPRVVVGVGKGVEVGVNVAATDSIGSTLLYVQPNIKWQFYANEDKGVATTMGAIAFTPLKDRKSNDSFGLFYGNVSKKFKGDYGPRFTVGGYGLAGYDYAGLDKGGAMVGYEQPVGKKASFVADWFSGKNGFGYVTPGFSFTLPKSSLFNIGYSIGNYGRKNNGLFVYYGITF